MVFWACLLSRFLFFFFLAVSEIIATKSGGSVWCSHFRFSLPHVSFYLFCSHGAESKAFSQRCPVMTHTDTTSISFNPLFSLFHLRFSYKRTQQSAYFNTADASLTLQTPTVDTSNGCIIIKRYWSFPYLSL